MYHIFNVILYRTSYYWLISDLVFRTDTIVTVVVNMLNSLQPTVPITTSFMGNHRVQDIILVLNSLHYVSGLLFFTFDL